MIYIEWANAEQDTLIWKFTTRTTLEEFFAAKRQADAMVDQVDGIVDSIFLASTSQQIPSNALSNFRTIIETRHKRSDKIVVVGAKSLLWALLNVLMKVISGAQQQIHFVSSLDEANVLIANAKMKRSPIFEKAG